MRLAAGGKDQRKIITAVGRETAGLHLGYRGQGGSCQQAADGGLTKSKYKNKSKNFPKMKKQKPDE